MKKKYKSYITPLVFFLFSLAFFMLPFKNIPKVDSFTEKYFNEAITKAGVSYATVRVINASVSILKGSDLELEPAGIGLSIAVGEVLDPIDDMTERVSDILVTSLASLGVTKIVYEIFKSGFNYVVGIVFIALGILYMFQNKNLQNIKNFFLKSLAVLVVLRFALVFVSFVNYELNEIYFYPKIETVKQNLTFYISDDKIARFDSIDDADGLVDTIKENFKKLKTKTIELKDVFDKMLDNSSKIIANLLELTYLYIALFLIQVIILPLSVFYILIKSVNILFGKNYNYIIKSRR